jgi:hypothetical protein
MDPMDPSLGCPTVKTLHSSQQYPLQSFVRNSFHIWLHPVTFRESRARRAWSAFSPYAEENARRVLPFPDDIFQISMLF